MIIKCKQAVGGRPPRYAFTPCKLTISSYLFVRWHLFRHVGYLRHQQQVDLWPFDIETGVWVMCDVGYLCANFSLYVGLSVLELGLTYATDVKQTDVRRPMGRRHNKEIKHTNSYKVFNALLEPVISLICLRIRTSVYWCSQLRCTFGTFARHLHHLPGFTLLAVLPLTWTH